MSKTEISLFCEDRAHEEFIKALVNRIAKEQNIDFDLNPRVSRGGHGSVMTELKLFQMTIFKKNEVPPDLIIVAIDSNCQRHNETVKNIYNQMKKPLKYRLAAACPDPYIERWFVVDPESFAATIGIQPELTKEKCERGFYKNILRQAIRKAGHPLLLDGIEFARDIVNNMDFYRAGKNDSSLKLFLDELRALLS